MLLALILECVSVAQIKGFLVCCDCTLALLCLLPGLEACR